MKHPGGRPTKPATERAGSILNVRVREDQKAAYYAAAAREGVKPAEWVKGVLDSAAQNRAKRPDRGTGKSRTDRR